MFMLSEVTLDVNILGMKCNEVYLRAGVASLLRGVDPVAMKEAGRGRALRDGI